jgi:hypothetical protein
MTSLRKTALVTRRLAGRQGFQALFLTTGITATDRAPASTAASYPPVTEGIAR